MLSSEIIEIHCDYDHAMAGHGSLLKLRQFHCLNLPQYTQLQMSTNIVGKVPVNPAMDKRPDSEGQYKSLTCLR